MPCAWHAHAPCTCDGRASSIRLAPASPVPSRPPPRPHPTSHACAQAHAVHLEPSHALVPLDCVAATASDAALAAERAAAGMRGVAPRPLAERNIRQPKAGARAHTHTDYASWGQRKQQQLQTTNDNANRRRMRSCWKGAVISKEERPHPPDAKPQRCSYKTSLCRIDEKTNRILETERVMSVEHVAMESGG